METGDGALRLVVQADEDLRHVITRLMNLARALVQYIAERDLYHLPEKAARGWWGGSKHDLRTLFSWSTTPST
ncbi:MAG: hypothetical protein ACKPKO_44865, partial [Candidatus Fonsibacter sp.]